MTRRVSKTRRASAEEQIAYSQFVQGIYARQKAAAPGGKIIDRQAYQAAADEHTRYMQERGLILNHSGLRKEVK